jgi:hypothetical protein
VILNAVRWWQKLEGLAMNKQRTNRFHMETFSLKKLYDVEGKNKYHFQVLYRYVDLGDFCC